MAGRLPTQFDDGATSVVSEAAALEADVADRDEMQAVSALMASMHAPNVDTAAAPG